jgi:hypothetical protein
MAGSALGFEIGDLDPGALRPAFAHRPIPPKQKNEAAHLPVNGFSQTPSSYSKLS